MSVRVTSIPYAGAVISAPIWNFVLFDTEYLEPGKETFFFVNARCFARNGVGMKFFGTHTNVIGLGGQVPLGHFLRRARLQLPETIDREVGGGEPMIITLPRPELMLASGEPPAFDEHGRFDLGPQENFRVRVPAFDLPDAIPVQMQIVCDVYFRPLAG